MESKIMGRLHDKIALRTRKVKGQDKEIVRAYHMNPQNLSDDELKNVKLVDENEMPLKPNTGEDESKNLWFDPDEEILTYEVNQK